MTKRWHKDHKNPYVTKGEVKNVLGLNDSGINGVRFVELT